MNTTQILYVGFQKPMSHHSYTFQCCNRSRVNFMPFIFESKRFIIHSPFITGWDFEWMMKRWHGKVKDNNFYSSYTFIARDFKKLLSYHSCTFRRCDGSCMNDGSPATVRQCTWLVILNLLYEKLADNRVSENFLQKLWWIAPWFESEFREKLPPDSCFCVLKWSPVHFGDIICSDLDTRCQTDVTFLHHHSEESSLCMYREFFLFFCHLCGEASDCIDGTLQSTIWSAWNSSALKL